MNPFQTRPGRSAVNLFNRYREYRRRTIAARLIDELPTYLKRDIGWPSAGDLDLDGRS